MRMAGQGLQQLTGLGSLDYGGISEAGMQGRANERIMGHEAAAQTHGYGLQALASIGEAEAQAEAAIAQGQAAGQSAMVSGLFKGIGSLAGGAIKGSGGGGPTYPGKTPDGYPLGRGSDGSYGGFGGKYGSIQPGSYTDLNPFAG